MITTVIFDKSMVAPCGMNCGTCIAYLREKNRCYGCRVDFKDKRKTCVECRIKNCDKMEDRASGFCYDCESFPCEWIKHMDIRYRTKYRTSLILNLLMIKEKGIESFLTIEAERGTCPDCGAVLSVHRNNCLKCQFEIKADTL
jgi:hypothetical protein